MSAVSLNHDITCGAGAPALSVDEARSRILTELVPVAGVEKLALRSALGRVLARDALSPVAVPAHTNSAVDGYALRGADLPAAGETQLHVVGTAWAGRPFEAGVKAGECVRIMTGAPMPAGTDTAVMQETVEALGDAIRVGQGHRTGENVRAAGEDLARGAVAVAAGRRLLPAELGLLASIGQGEVAAFRRLRVAFFSTGDELRSIGEPLGPGEIYDSNRYTLYGMLTRLGVDILDLGVIPDTREAVRQAFLDAAAAADVVITTGGVSVGEADYVKETLASIGSVSFWQISMKPGRPLAFGRIGEAAFFGLPGNPVAVMVAFYQFVQPALRRMQGERGDVMPESFRVRSASPFKKRAGRTEFYRAVLARTDDGELTVRSIGHQGSGILRSMSLANCFVVLPHETGNVEPGALVEVQSFFGIV
jgi:molybdopterin molybdotransferase